MGTITIDGSRGEGGGQVLRTSLALSVSTGRTLVMVDIRAGRRKPGLSRQHLTCVEAAAAISGAEVSGAEMRSTALTFEPGPVRAGDYRFSIGTAGSAGLVLQTVLPPLLLADGPSTVRVEGGTHNPFAPPFEFLDRVFRPHLERMGAGLDLTLERHGFFPVGGGAITMRIEPPGSLRPIEILERGRIRARRATALVAKLPAHVGERELGVVRKKLGWSKKETLVREIGDSAGPGNALLLEVASDSVSEIATAFGERKRPAEQVASRAVTALRRYLKGDAPVGEHLADQLLLPFALAGGGAFRTLPLTNHTTTNIDVIREFLPVSIESSEEPGGTVRVVVE